MTTTARIGLVNSVKIGVTVWELVRILSRLIQARLWNLIHYYNIFHFLQAINQTGGFTKVWLSLKCIFFPSIIGILSWFWRRISALQRKPQVLEIMLLITALSLTLLNGKYHNFHLPYLRLSTFQLCSCSTLVCSVLKLSTYLFQLLLNSSLWSLTCLSCCCWQIFGKDYSTLPSCRSGWCSPLNILWYEIWAYYKCYSGFLRVS